MRLKRLVALMLVMSITWSQCIETFAQAVAQDMAAEEQLMEMLRVDDEFVAQHPNGQFEFLATRMNASEDLNSVEIAVIRKGGTEGEAEIDLKAIDVSAKYGEDYVIRVKDRFFSKTLDANPEARPLTDAYSEVGKIEESSGEINDEDIIAVIDDVATGSGLTVNKVLAEETGLSLEDIDVSKQAEDEAVYDEPEKELEESYSEDSVEAEISEDAETEKEVSNSPKRGLRMARNAYTGEISERKSWTEYVDTSNQQAISLANQSIIDWAEDMPGVSTTLKFDDGEYMKTIVVEIKDDNLSETDEQIIFVLSEPTAGSLGENYKAFLNIEDNDENEIQQFEMAEDSIEVNREDKVAVVKIKRTAGIAKFGSVYVSTAEITAKHDVDYGSTAEEIVFPQGVTERTVEIPILKEHALQDGLQFKVVMDKSSETVNKSKAETIVNLNNNNMEFALASGAMDVLSGEETFLADGLKQDENGYYREIVFSDEYGIQTLAAGDDATKDLNGLEININNSDQPNHEESKSISADLTGVDYIIVDWENNTNGTYWETKKCGKVQNSGYYTNGSNWVTFGGSSESTYADSSTIRFDRVNKKITVPADTSAKKENSSIVFHTQILNNNKNSSLKVYSVKLYYSVITVNLGTNTTNQANNNDKYNALVDTRTWEISGTEGGGYSFDSNNNTVFTKTGYRQAGGIAFKNISGNSAQVYYGKQLSFDSTIEDDLKDKVYFAGIFISNGSNGIFLEDQPSITLNYDFFKNYSQYMIGPYGSTPTFTVYPVYFPRYSFIYFPSTPDGSMVSHNKKDETDLMKVSMLDTVKLQAVPNSGKYVSGFNTGSDASAGGLNTNDDVYKTSVSSFRKSNLKTAYENTDGNTNDVRKDTTGAFGWDANNSSLLTVKPNSPFIQITPYYGNPNLSVRVNPNNSNKDKGAIYYTDGDNSDVGDKDKPISVNPVDMGKIYTFNSIAQDGYMTKWQDFSGDTNGDGIISPEEAAAVSEYKFDRSAVATSVFNYVTGKYPTPIIYYGFYPEYTSENPGIIEGYLKMIKKPVFSDKTTTINLENAQITVGDMSMVTGADGSYHLESSSFADGDKAMLSIYYDDIFYSCTQNVNAAEIIKLNEYDTFSVTNAKLKKDGVEIKPAEVENFDATLGIELTVASESPQTNCTKAVFRTYGKDGSLLFTDTVESPDNNGKFIYELNPASKGVQVGSTMTVQFFDQNNRGYTVHDLGITYGKYLGTFSILASFKGLSTAFQLIGELDSAIGLGLSGKTDDHFTTSTATEEGVEVNYKTLTFGFSKDFEKELGEKDKKKDEDDKKKDEDDKSGDASKQKSDTLKNSIKERAEDGKQDTGLNEKIKDATNKDAKDNKKETEISAKAKLTLSVGLQVIMVKSDEEDGQYYFKDLLFTVTADGGIGTEITVPTPILINILIGFDISGEVNGGIVISKGALGKESYFDGNGGIDFGNMAMLSGSEATSEMSDFTFYGYLEVKPSITLSAGVGLSSLLEVKVSGKAVFDLNFDTIGKSKGDVTFSAALSVKVLFFTKEWELASTTVDLFNNGKGKLLRTVDDNPLFASIDTMEKDDTSYMLNRGNFIGKGLALMSEADGNLSASTRTLLAGSNPKPRCDIEKLPDGRYMLLFIDDDISKDLYNYPTVAYSIYSDGVWSDPVAIDNDDTLDESPDLFVLDNGTVMAVWSSAEEKITSNDDAIEALNKINIKSAVFDGNSFSEPVTVTHSTSVDLCSDIEPKLASGIRDGRETIIMYYTKTEYVPSGANGEGLMGDILLPYSVIAYMFYDVESGEWINTYSEEDKQEIIESGAAYTYDGQLVTEDNFHIYEEEWYGQNFVTVGTDVIINDADVIDEDGFWTSMPEFMPGEHIADPLIVDSDVISYDNLAVFAYTIDFDGDNQTIYDREIYVQVYDFDTNAVYYDIQITSNDSCDCNVELERFGESVYLVWLSDGNIKFVDFSNIYRDCLLEVNVGSEPEYVVNKLRETNEYIPEAIVADAGDDTEIGEFIIASDENENVYVIWTQFDLTYKDGIDQTSAEATLPENQYVERQIYAVKYESDPEHVYGTLSAPVKVTEEQGANYSNMAAFITNDRLISVAAKGMSSIDPQYGVCEDINSRTLTEVIFNIIDKISIEEVSADDYYGDGTVNIDVAVKNSGFENDNGVYIEVYSDGVLADRCEIGDLASGIERVVTANVPTGEIEVRLFNSKGQKDSSVINAVLEHELSIDYVSAEISARDMVTISADITNNGPVPVENVAVHVESVSGDCSDKAVIDLIGAGQSAHVNIAVDINDDVFTPITVKDDSYYSEELAEFIVSTDYSNDAQADVVRYLTKDEKALLNGLSPVLNGGASSIDVAAGDYELIYNNVTENNPKLKAIYESSDESIAMVSADGIISGIARGTAEITVRIMPSDRAVIVFANGISQTEDIYLSIPKEGIITRTITVNVTENGSSEESTTETTTAASRPSGGGSGPRKTAETTEVTTEDSAVESTKDTTPTQTDVEKEPEDRKVFDDVKGTWAEEAVMYLADMGIISGIGNNLFAPERNVTRAEFVTMLMRMLDLDVDTSDVEQFTDVSENAYYSEYLLKARGAGIAAGYEEGVFSPESSISRQDMFAFIERALTLLDKLESDEEYILLYDDTDEISPYAAESIRKLSSAGIVKGSNNFVKPKDNAKRNEAAQTIYNIVKIAELSN